MARFSFRLPAIRLNDRRAPSTPRRRPAALSQTPALAWASRRAVAAAALRAGDLADDAQALESSSWFESTWDLQQGLDIAEAQVVDLPLELWLQVSLTA
jgi:hypothetical protein